MKQLLYQVGPKAIRLLRLMAKKDVSKDAIPEHIKMSWLLRHGLIEFQDATGSYKITESGLQFLESQ